MIETPRKLHSILDPGDRRKALLLIVLMVVNAFAQTLAIASVMPFLAVVGNPAIIETNAWLQLAYVNLGFEDTRSFLFFLGLVSAVLFIGGIAVQAFSQWVITRFSFTQQYKLSKRLMGDYLQRPYAFFLNRNSGDLAKTVLQETNHAVNHALLPAMRLLSFGLTAAAIIVLLILVHPWLALTVAAVLGSTYAVIYIVSRAWLNRIGQDRVKANRERFTAAAEAFAGAKEIRLLGREQSYLERFKDPSRRFANHQANSSLLENMPQYGIEAIAFGGILVLVLFLLGGEGGLGQALPLIGLYGLAGKQLIPAFHKIFGAAASIRFSIASVDAVLDDLGSRPGSTPLPTAGDWPQPLHPQQAIALEHVSYRYPGADRDALQDLDVRIPARNTVGFIGSSGAGKSTLIDIVLGLLDPDSGRVLIDDQPLGRDNMRGWQAALGYVPQHIFLADQTVAENIALGLPPGQLDMQAVIRAAEMANLHDFVIRDLPEGYETIIGERGVRLSGGQRQRIGIARALYRDPSVLLFDEATSALDNATEHAVMEAIYRLSSEKTIILVAHRLSTVRACNRIYVLAQGRVVEEGTWEELANEGEHFRRLAVGEA